jgi:lipopolysaccharide biosynthesis regulator YciM
MAPLALAEWYKLCGQPGDAVACLQRALAVDPLCREGHLALVALYREQRLPGEVLDAYERLTHSATGLSCGRFRCRACGHAAMEPFWKCPACAIWATPQRLMPPPDSFPMASTAGPLSRDLDHPDTAVPIVAAQQASPHPLSDA